MSETANGLAATSAELADRLVRAASALLDLLPRKLTRKEYLDTVLNLLGEWSGCRCIGIRLLDLQGRIPYEAYRGFTPTFWAEENGLLLRRDECACTRVVLGRPDPLDLPAMTPRGAFCTSRLSAFAAQLPASAPFRGRCIRAGFESLAIVPLRHHERVLGAVHLADETPDRLAPDVVELLETVAPLIGTAIQTFDLQDALGLSVARYRAIVETAEEGICLLDKGGSIAFVNPRLANMLGVPRDELPGRGLLTFAAAESRGLLQAHLDRLERDGRATGDINWRRRDGTELWTSVSASPIVSEDGQATGALVMVADITDRKRAEAALQRANEVLEARVRERTAALTHLNAELRDANCALEGLNARLQQELEHRRQAEEALRRSEERFATAFQASPVAMALSSLKEDGRFRDVNATYVEVMGYSREELLGQTPLDLGMWRDPAERARVVLTLHIDGAVRDREVALVRKSGEAFTALLTMDVIEIAGEPVILSVIQDVTERKRAEAVRRSLALFPEQNPQPVLRVARNGTLLYANAASQPLLDVWGCTVGERLSGAATATLVDRLLASRATELEVACGDRLYALTCVPFEAEGYVNLYGHDVTERRRAEAALATQKTLLETILEQAADGITVRDADGRLIFANATAQRLAHEPTMGTRLEEAAAIWGETFDAAGQPLPLETWPISRALRGETVRSVEWHRVAPDGSRYVVLSSAAPLRDAGGGILGAVSITTDITERTRAEERLAAQERLLQTILDQAAEGITVRDAEGRVLFVNAVARRRALLPPDGTDLEQAVHVWGENLDATGRPIPVAQWPISRALRGEPLVRAEFQRVTPKGRVFLRSSAAPLRNAKGELVGAVAVTTDLTDRQQAEDRLRQALADNETLLREVHHRTKNNLQMLCDLLYLQMDRAEGRDPKALLQDTYGRIFAIARLHEQLYQSMEHGRIPLGEYLARLLAGFENLYGEVSVQLDRGAEGVGLDVDRAIHCGLLVNELITNALKHAFPPGQRGVVAVRVQTVGDQVELQVWDNGKGLPGGLDVEQPEGLGLRIVQILVRRLEGTLRVEEGGGSKFTIRFPLEAESPVEPRHV